MPHARLTQSRIDALTPRKAPYDVRDSDLKGFGLRVSPAGAKRFFVHGQQARRRGLPVSRYLVGLVLPDGSAVGSPADPLPALDGVEQRELLGAARLMRSLFSHTGGADADAALEGMRERFAALLHAGEPGDTASRRTGERA